MKVKPLGLKRQSVSVEPDSHVISVDGESAHNSSKIEIRRILRLDGNAHGVRFAPAVLAEYIDTVLAVVDQATERTLDPDRLRIRKEALIHRLLFARGGAFQEMVHLHQTAVVADIVGYEDVSAVRERFTSCPFIEDAAILNFHYDANYYSNPDANTKKNLRPPNDVIFKAIECQKPDLGGTEKRGGIQH